MEKKPYNNSNQLFIYHMHYHLNLCTTTNTHRKVRRSTAAAAAAADLAEHLLQRCVQLRRATAADAAAAIVAATVRIVLVELGPGSGAVGCDRTNRERERVFGLQFTVYTGKKRTK